MLDSYMMMDNNSFIIFLNNNGDDRYNDLLIDVRFWVQRVFVPFVTIIGIIGNSLTLLIMFQQKIRSITTTTHIYLATLAIFDMFYLIFSFLLSIQHYPLFSNENNNSNDLITSANNLFPLLYLLSYPGLRFCCDFASNTSIWLAVIFTIERYIAIRFPLRLRLFCTRSLALKMIPLIGLICFLLTMPTYFEWEICVLNHTHTCNESNDQYFKICPSQLANNETYVTVYLSFIIIIFTFIPLLLLTIMNGFLICSLKRQTFKRFEWIMNVNNSFNQRRRQRSRSNGTLTNTTTISSFSITSASFNVGGDMINIISKGQKQKLKHQQHQRSIKSSTQQHDLLDTVYLFNRYRMLRHQDPHITRLLIAIVIFFIICQLPSASFILYKILYNNNNNENFEKILGNIFNLLIAINSAGNFIIYCLLSRRYRQTLINYIRKIIKSIFI